MRAGRGVCGGGGDGCRVAVWAAALLVLVACQACVSAQQLTSEAAEQKIRELLELGRDVLPRGYPEFGVPVLDPWRVKSFELTVKETMIKLNFDATGVNIFNARTFVVNSLKAVIGPRNTTINLDLTIPLLEITADNYNLAGTAMLAFPVRGKGKMDVSLLDVRVLGAVTLDPAVPEVEELLLYVSVARVQAKLTGTTSLVNRLLSQHGAALVNGKRDEISAAVRDQLVPPINEYLAIARPAHDLKALLQ